LTIRSLYLIVSLTVLVLYSPLLAQEQTKIQTFTPSVLLVHQQFEIKIFNNIYSQTSFRDDEKNKIDLGERQNFLTSQWQFSYGVSKNGRLNVGLDFYIQAVRYDSVKSTSPFKLFSKDGASFSRSALAYIGPRVKFSPIKKVPRLSVQSAFLLVVERNLETPRFLAHDGSTWWTQFFYDHTIKKFQFFLEGSIIYRFKENSEQIAFMRAPVSLFINYFPLPQFTIYTMIQHSPVFKRLPEGSETTFARTGHFTQAGIGLKYQITDEFDIELLYTNFLDSRNDGAGSTYNLGLRFIQ
jgi:hypothetical protein